MHNPIKSVFEVRIFMKFPCKYIHIHTDYINAKMFNLYKIRLLKFLGFYIIIVKLLIFLYGNALK